MSNFDKLYTPLKRSKKKEHKVLACDTETIGLGGAFIIGAALEDVHGEPEFFYSQDAMIDYLLSPTYKGYEFLLHNLEYDLRYFMEAIQNRVTNNDYKVEIVSRKDERIIAFKVKQGRNTWTFRDTYALMTTPLANLATMAGMEKLDIGLKDGEIFDPNNEEHMQYLDRDVRMLLAAFLNNCESTYKTFGIYPGLTAGSTAQRAIRTTLKRVYWRQREEVEDFARLAYYGGLTFLRSTAKHENMVTIDGNGMYAAAMREGVPIGSGCYTTVEMPELPGIYRCRVFAPKSIPFTMVPHRSKDGISWPHGEFETHLPSITIEYARELGYTIDVIEGYVFDEIEHIFDEFVKKCEDIEAEYKGTAIGDTIKILRNSGYGKYGQGKEGKSYILTPEPDEDYTPFIDKHTGEPVQNLFWKDEIISQAHMMPVWAAWITANARILLVKAVYAVGPQHVVNGDTDSLTASHEAIEDAIMEGRISIGKKYGQWKREKEWQWFRAIGPKNYLGQLKNGGTVQRCKGIPLRRLSFEDQIRAADGERISVNYLTVNKNLSIMKGNQPSTIDRVRSVSTLANSYAWQKVGNKVIPIVIGGD